MSGLSTVASFVLPLVGRPNPLDAKMVAQMRAPAFVCTSAALTADLGWQAQVGLDETLERTLAGYRERGWL